MMFYKDKIREVFYNEKWRQATAKLVEEKGLDEKEYKIFTAMCVIAYEYGEGDVLAGLVLDKMAENEACKEVFKKVFGKTPLNHSIIYSAFFDTEYFKVLRDILK